MCACRNGLHRLLLNVWVLIEMVGRSEGKDKPLVGLSFYPPICTDFVELSRRKAAQLVSVFHQRVFSNRDKDLSHSTSCSEAGAY